MSNFKVDTISGLGTNGIKINSPVGVNTNAPTTGMSVSGKLSVSSSAEVVTVEGENFGVKIKAGNSTNAQSILHLTNNSGSTIRHKILAPQNKNIEFAIPSGIYDATTLAFPSGGTGTTFSIGITGSKISNFSTAIFEQPCSFTGNYLAGNEYILGGAGSRSLAPKCTGIATENDHIINLELLYQSILGPTTMKTWSVFGSLDNAGVKWGKHVSGNFFRKLFNWKRVTCCCGCRQEPGSLNQGVYNDVLQGTWIVVAFSVGQRSCSCSDNEQFNFPIDDSAVWKITNQSIRSTISSNITGTYNLFGFAFKPLYNIDDCYFDTNGDWVCP